MTFDATRLMAAINGDNIWFLWGLLWLTLVSMRGWLYGMFLLDDIKFIKLMWIDAMISKYLGYFCIGYTYGTTRWTIWVIIIIIWSTRWGILNWSPYDILFGPFDEYYKWWQYMVVMMIAIVYVGMFRMVVYMGCFYWVASNLWLKHMWIDARGLKILGCWCMV